MIKIDKFSIKQLKQKFENRQFAIPEIQRQFVWNKNKVINLMDSIYKHYPIGISLIWNTSFSKVIQLRPNRKTIIPPYNRRSKKFDLIIDGQQRLSTLYGILFGQEPKPEANSDINFKELYFDCSNKAIKRFMFSKKIDGDVKGKIKLYDILNKTPKALQKQLKLTKWETKAIEKCYYAFAKYKFYILTFEDLDINDVREVFIRINSSGMTVSRADSLFAKASNIKLRDLVLDTRRGLKYNFDTISIDAMQNTLALAYGAKEIGNRAFEAFLKTIEKNKKKDNEFHRIWKKLQYGYEQAVDFLVSELNITSPQQLPSQNIYTMLSFFFYLKSSRADNTRCREIKKWFWHTACGERYSGAAFNRNIPKDIAFFKRLAKNGNTKYSIPVYEKIDPVGFLKSSYNTNSSATKSYFILLRNKSPLYLSNGKKILLDNTSAISNRKDRHHIYPRDLLNRNKINSKWKNSIANICYIASNENQSISNSHPSKYLSEYKRKKYFSKVMKSHLIPYNSDSPVWSKSVKAGFKEFLNRRNKLIISEVEKIVKVKLFEKLDDVKRI